MSASPCIYAIHALCLLALSSFGARGSEGPQTTTSAPTPASSVVSCASQEESLAAAESSLDRAKAEIALARCILVSKTASPLSRFIAGDVSAREQLGLHAREAGEHLDRAAELLDKTVADEDAVSRVQDCIEMLRAFAEMFATLAEDGSNDEHRQRLLDASIGLSLYLDDTRREVVESARLWQGAAYRRAGRSDRALQVLRPVLSSSMARDIGFWARIERCRALADGKHFAAAMALANRLSPRVEAWFEDDDAETRRAATDSIRWLRAELLAAWGRHLREQGQSERADDAMKEAELIMDSVKSPPAPDRWLPLREGVSGLTPCESALDAAAITPAKDK